MPGDDDFTRRLDTLLDDLLGDRPVEAPDILLRIRRLLAPSNHAVAQGRITRRLKAIRKYSAERAVRAACAMHLSGVPPHRLVHFLSASLPGSVTLSQFELAGKFIFDDEPPLSPQLIYDLTQYTYLEKKLLTQRSVELATRLKGSLTSRLLLYLYMLSLRDDLSNENAHLILLILRICFPALKVSGRTQISAAERREVADAWKNVQKSARYAQILPLPRGEARADRLPRESASYFLDKYYSDAGVARGAASAMREEIPPVPGRLSFIRSSSRGGVPRTPQTVKERSAKGKRARRNSARTAVRRMARRPERPGAALRPAVRAAMARPIPEPVVQPASPSAAGKKAGGRLHGWSLSGRTLSLGPFILAAVLFVAAFSASLWQFDLRGSVRRASRAGAIIETPLATQPTAARQAPPPTHVVQRGDSLWKIYRSLHDEGTVVGEWKDFLRLMSEQNDLPNPDKIYPGNVLSITTETR